LCDGSPISSYNSILNRFSKPVNKNFFVFLMTFFWIVHGATKVSVPKTDLTQIEFCPMFILFPHTLNIRIEVQDRQLKISGPGYVEQGTGGFPPGDLGRWFNVCFTRGPDDTRKCCLIGVRTNSEHLLNPCEHRLSLEQSPSGHQSSLERAHASTGDKSLRYRYIYRRGRKRRLHMSEAVCSCL